MDGQWVGGTYGEVDKRRDEIFGGMPQRDGRGSVGRMDSKTDRRTEEKMNREKDRQTDEWND